MPKTKKYTTPGEDTVIERSDLNYLATVSHEIRNPLNTVIGISRLLRSPASEEEKEKYIESLHETSENLLDLVNNIMDLSKLESGFTPLERRTTDLRVFLEKSLRSKKALANSKGLELRIETVGKFPVAVWTDPVKLRQVILNLVSNAIKFTRQGSVVVSMKSVIKDYRAQVQFSVRDSGIGIPEEEIHAVFEPFEQGRDDINLKYGGTGLGLSICRRIVSMMGGSLEVNSAVGKGSEFSFQLDFEIADELPLKLASTGSAAVNFEKRLKILVVDDSSLNLMVVGKNLELWGIDFDTALDGSSAIEKIGQQEFDLVLMDLHMPGMDGFATTRKIRELTASTYPYLPIIGLTAATEKDLRERTNSSGFTDILSKPFRPEDLLEKIMNFTKPGMVS